MGWILRRNSVVGSSNNRTSHQIGRLRLRQAGNVTELGRYFSDSYVRWTMFVSRFQLLEGAVRTSSQVVQGIHQNVATSCSRCPQIAFRSLQSRRRGDSSPGFTRALPMTQSDSPESGMQDPLKLAYNSTTLNFDETPLKFGRNRTEVREKFPLKFECNLTSTATAGCSTTRAHVARTSSLHRVTALVTHRRVALF